VASRPVRRILSRRLRSVERVAPEAAIPLGRRLPAGSSGLPGGVCGRAVLPLSGLAPGGVCRAARVAPGAGALLPHRFTLTCAGRTGRPARPRHRRSAFCGTFLRVAPTGCYPAPCPVESGRSSGRDAEASGTRPPGRLATISIVAPNQADSHRNRLSRPGGGRRDSRRACRARSRGRGSRRPDRAGKPGPCR
jgi:hypothetical protein